MLLPKMLTRTMTTPRTASSSIWMQGTKFTSNWMVEKPTEETTTSTAPSRDSSSMQTETRQTQRVRQKGKHRPTGGRGYVFKAGMLSSFPIAPSSWTPLLHISQTKHPGSAAESGRKAPRAQPERSQAGNIGGMGSSSHQNLSVSLLFCPAPLHRNISNNEKPYKRGPLHLSCSLAG